MPEPRIITLDDFPTIVYEVTHLIINGYKFDVLSVLGEAHLVEGQEIPSEYIQDLANSWCKNFYKILLEKINE